MRSPVVPGSRATAHGRIFDALLDDGSKLNAEALIERVGWTLDLIDEMAHQVLAEHWNTAHIGRTSGTGPDGRLLPRFAYKALERLGWAPTLPTDVHLCSRLRPLPAQLARPPTPPAAAPPTALPPLLP